MRVLCLDSGSSSLKYALFDMPSERRMDAGTEGDDAADQPKALDAVIARFRSRGDRFDAIGHRLVFGGPDHTMPELIDEVLLARLDALVPYDPLHLPTALAVIRGAFEIAPGVPQVACFDTAFHRRMPALSKRYPLPDDLGPMVRRYGYHGISYEYIVSTGAARGRTVIAHLGNGASLAAVKNGEPVDTTMGFSPMGGLMMGTRPGDLDPAVLLFLLRTADFDLESLTSLLNTRCGLLGVSGISADMRTLLERTAVDAAAKEAVDLFVYLAVKQVGAMVAALGGLDVLIFTGGIGEHAAPIRRDIGAGCAYLGVEIDNALNEGHAERISSNRSSVTVLIIPTDENLMIARHVFECVGEPLRS